MNELTVNEDLFFHIEKMVRAMKEYTLLEFKKHQFPVTKDQWLILKRIGDTAGSNQREIAESTFKDPAALTRILDILVKKGLAKRETDSKDRRTFTIHLTVDGSRLVNRMLPVVQETRNKALSGITENEENQIKELMKKITLNF